MNVLFVCGGLYAQVTDCTDRDIVTHSYFLHVRMLDNDFAAH